MKISEKFFSLLFFLVYSSPLFSQPTKLDTKVSYGNFTQDQFFKVKSQIIPQGSSIGDLISKGALFISFTHPMSEHISAGAAFGSNKLTGDIISNSIKTGTLNRNLFTLSIESDFVYFKRKNLSLYGVLGCGYTFGQDEYITNNGEKEAGYIGFMAFQVSPASIRLGNRFALFFEAGFGYKGIISNGFTYNF